VAVYGNTSYVRLDAYDLIVKLFKSQTKEKAFSMLNPRHFLFNLHALVLRLDRIANTYLLKPFGISYAEFLALVTIRDRPGIGPLTLASQLGLGKSSVSLRIGKLEDKGLAIRTMSKKNRV